MEKALESISNDTQNLVDNNVNCWICDSHMQFVGKVFNKHISKMCNKYKCEKCGEIVYSIFQ